MAVGTKWMLGMGAEPQSINHCFWYRIMFRAAKLAAAVIELKVARPHRRPVVAVAVPTTGEALTNQAAAEMVVLQLVAVTIEHRMALQTVLGKIRMKANRAAVVHLVLLRVIIPQVVVVWSIKVFMAPAVVRAVPINPRLAVTRESRRILENRVVVVVVITNMPIGPTTALRRSTTSKRKEN